MRFRTLHDTNLSKINNYVSENAQNRTIAFASYYIHVLGIMHARNVYEDSKTFLCNDSTITVDMVITINQKSNPLCGLFLGRRQFRSGVDHHQHAQGPSIRSSDKIPGTTCNCDAQRRS